VAVQQLHRNVPRLSGPNTIRCLNTLAAAPEIAGKVRTFNIYSSFAVGRFITALPPASVRPSGKDIWNRLLAIFGPSPPPAPPLAPLRLLFIAGSERISLQTTARSFYNMKNLHTLIIHAPSHPKLWEFEYPIPTLRTIFVHRNAESPSLFAWIMTQQSITYLRMNGISPVPPPIAKWYSLPNLRYLICNPLGVFHLFPGGRVSELIIESLIETWDMPVVDHLAAVIASSSAKSGIQLQRLTVYGEKVAINQLLDRLGHLLTHLLFLRIFIVDMPRESVSPIPQLLLTTKGPVLTALNSPYRNVFSSTLSYQSSLVSKLLNFSPRCRVLGIQALPLRPPD